MKILSRLHRRRSEAGVALLIAIFVLLLIGVTAIALILSSGAESALAGNYRSSASVYYAALAGVEEARGRLLPSNPDYLGPALTALGTPLAPGKVIYILNPNPLTGEIVNPTDLTNPATYPDTEYQKEFPGTPITNLQQPNSVSPAAGLPGPLYKWVRINAATEKSLNVDVNNDGTLDTGTPLFFDPSHVDPQTGNPKPSLIVTAAPPSSAAQALEITALAALPNGTQKLLQYVVASSASAANLNFTGAGSQSPSFPAALTLDGNNVNFDGPTSTAFNINGNDQFRVGSCAPGTNAVSAIGYTNGSDPSLSNILSGIVAGNQSHYSGAGTASPNVSNVNGLPANYQTPSGLDSLVQNITQGADSVIQGPVTQSDSPSPNNVFPSAMISPNSNPNPNPMPMTVVVNGDLAINNWHDTGYGVLVVTGTLTYDPDASWNGIILVIGQGQFISTRGGSGQINGAVFVARTRDSSGHLLPTLGAASYRQTGGGQGIYYSSCWINASQRPSTYKVLSFRQLSQ
jgi:hypothetical protein